MPTVSLAANQQAFDSYLEHIWLPQELSLTESSGVNMATKLLSDEATRDVFLVVYELLKKDAGADLLGSTRTWFSAVQTPKKENSI